MRGKDLLRDVLGNVKDGKLSVSEAGDILEGFPSLDIGEANIDCGRYARCGFPEAVYCEGKTFSQIKRISTEMIDREGFVLLTRLSAPVFRRLKRTLPRLRYNSAGRVSYFSKKKITKRWLPVPVITGGTSDIPVAEEARATLEAMGHKVERIYDVGVAGIHRLFNARRRFTGSNVIIVVAGMEGALASVVGGLVSKPVIAVPTSSGYGASFKGLAPLLTMLNSCAPGISVVNIDNGFGAAYIAGLINKS